MISVRRNSSDPCFAGVTVRIAQASDIAATTTVTNATCSNNDGSILVGTISGGTSPYTFKLDGSPIALPSNNRVSGLAGGNHTLTITDANSCSKDFIVPITFPGYVDFVAGAINPDCSSNGSNGGILVAINSSGSFQVGITTDPVNPPASFVDVISSGTGTQVFNNLSKATYQIYVKSVGALCPSKTSVSISAGPDQVDFNFTSTNILCFEDKGLVTLSAIRGASLINFNYEIVKQGLVAKSGIITTLQALGNVPLTGLDKGDYQIRIMQDQSAATGCTSPISSAFKIFSILGPDQALDTLYVNRAISLPDLATGSILVGVKESQQEPYEVRLELMQPLFPIQSFILDWTAASRNPQNLKIELGIKNLFAGDYQLLLRDALGCVKEYLFTLNVDTNISVPNIFTPNGDGVNDVFFIRNLPSDANLVITNRWGKEVYASGDYQNDWGGGEIADGVYFYRLSLTSEALTGWVEIMRGK